MKDLLSHMPDWMHLQLESEGDLKMLGRKNLLGLTKYLKREIRDEADHLTRLESDQKLLEGKSNDDITKMSVKYENPTIELKMGDNWSGEPEPYKPEDVARKEGDTTFNRCGWCKYASGGSRRYNYMISGNCSILENANLGWRLKIDSECMLKVINLGKVRKGLRFMHIKTSVKKSVLENVVIELEKVATTLENKPCLPILRPSDYFNVGDKIIVFVGNVKDNSFNKPFIKAMVINGYRHHDGCVSFKADEKWHDGPYFKGMGGSCGVDRGDIMLVSDGYTQIIDTKTQ